MLHLEESLSESEAELLNYERVKRYWHAAEEKRQSCIGKKDQSTYYTSLVNASMNRSDPASVKDRHQINKDLPRTFEGLAPGQGKDMASLLPLLYRILTAYIERGRSVSATRRTQTVGSYDRQSATVTQLHSRGLLTGYPQGLNFLAGMGLLAAGGALWKADSSIESLEHTAFWLLALLLEDILDPDFFGADVKDNLQMAFIGGLGMKSLVLQRAETECPVLFDALGHEAFESSLSVVLDQWVLSLFVGCIPSRLLEHLWDHLLLPSAEHAQSPSEKYSDGRSSRESKTCPQGLAYIVAFTLAVLRCCGDEKLGGTEVLSKLKRIRDAGATAEDISLEAGDAMKAIRQSLLRWPPEQDDHLLGAASEILEKFMQDERAAGGLWDDVREQKQRIADCAGNFDDQLIALARRTHFSEGEIQRARSEFKRISGKEDGRVDLKTFKEVVSNSVPAFPLELCGRLFDKLDAFCVGHLSFVELLCGMSALSLGTMDEKLQVCFDLFDSEDPPGALTLKELGDLCAVLFRVALAQGFMGARKVSRHEDIDTLDDASIDSSPNLDRDRKGSDRKGSGSRVRSNSNPPMQGRMARSCPNIDPDAVKQDDDGVKSNSSSFTPPPWRSMLLRLLAAAHVRTVGCPSQRVVTFEDFRQAARNEPALLCLFSWCLPRPPAVSETDFIISPHPSMVGSELLVDPPQVAERCSTRWKCLLFWRRNRQEEMILMDDGVSLPATSTTSFGRYRAPLPVVTRGLPKVTAR